MSRTTEKIMPAPTEAELKAALDVVARAEAHIAKLMVDAAIPGSSASIWSGINNIPTVRLQANCRVFKNHDGKRNLESLSVFYRTASATIDAIGDWLAPHRTKSTTP